MAEFDWSINWSSVRKYARPSEHLLQVFVGGEEVTHVRRCITGELGVCVAFGLDDQGRPQPYLDRMLYGVVEVRERSLQEEVPAAEEAPSAEEPEPLSEEEE